tara:strand:+ start:665 stop:1048 length:384 start_codon:yes stop_codon:yes gene_type:complete
LIAGGVGIALLLGILRQLHLEKDPRPTVLVYGNRAEEQIVYYEEFEKLTKEHGTEIVHVLHEPREEWTGPVGMIDANLVRQIFASPEMKNWLYLICGPSMMMENVEDTLVNMGIPSRQILSERFDYA